MKLHEIDAHHLFRNGVFDLQSSVGFDEDKLWIRSSCIDQKLKGTKALIALCASKANRGIDDAMT